jgi:hypothetical protein
MQLRNHSAYPCKYLTNENQGKGFRLCRLYLKYCMKGFGLVNGFIDHLYRRLLSTSNYSAVANQHSSQIATAHAKPLPASRAFTSRSLATASGSGDSLVHALKSFLRSLLCGPPLNLLCPLLIISQHGPSRSTRPESVSTQRILDLVVSLSVNYHCVYGIGPLAHYKYKCTCTSMRRTHCRDVESSPHNN